VPVEDPPLHAIGERDSIGSGCGETAAARHDP
jgi:hypothetical protein